MGETDEERSSQASQLFENFVQASTCKGTLQAFGLLCRQLELDPADHRGFYGNLKAAVTSWKAKALWTKLDKRANHKEYKKGRACTDIRCLIIGGGPCGLRTAIELALLGAKVVVIEKRDSFSRNNVLHLWPYTIHDLRNLGAKKFYGKFCAGAIDHISIRQLQLILLKVSLIVGVEVHVNVEFLKLREPPEQQKNDGSGWRAELHPASHPVSDYDFDVLIGADGRRSTLDGFKRKEFRGKLAIAITANFVNRNTTAEAKVEEISGVAFIFNQKFFLELKEETGIDLENIVYYKDNTHYFVMTAKKQSLLDKGVIIHDYIETERLLHSDNVNQEALLSYAREAADFGTNYQLPSLDYAMNHYAQPDVAMFDFTCMYASENAAVIREKNGHQLLVALVGDSLLEPFWPMGTGCARGFLAAFDTVWMVQGWAQGKAPLEVLSERESIYRLLPQTTAENISKNFEQYTIDPATRYPNLNSTCVRPHQVQHLYINGEQNSRMLERSGLTRRSVNISRKESEVRPSRLLLWCQKQTQGYKGVNVTDLTTSWRSGLALCALIHHQRPDLIDFNSLNEADSARNNQLAFELAEKAFGIQPLITGKEMAAEKEPDKLVMVLYLSKFHEMFRNSSSPASGIPWETNEDISSNSNNTVCNLTNLALHRKRIPKDEKIVEDNDNKKRRKAISYLEELSKQSTSTAVEEGEQKENKVRSMATQLQAKFEENAPGYVWRRQSASDSYSEKPVSLDMTENPRFAKPKLQSSCPPSSPKPKWKPSPYLRLLESQKQPGHKHGQAETQDIQFHSVYHAMDNQSGFQTPEVQFTCQTTEAWSRHQSTSEPRPGLQCISVSATQLLTLKHVLRPEKQPSISSKSSDTFSLSTPALGGMLQRLKILEDKITQNKVQTPSAREFSKKSIRERAEQLSFLFSGTPSQKIESSPAPASPPPKPLSCPSLPEPSALSCVLSPLPEAPPTQCNGHSESEEVTHDHRGQKSQSEIKRAQCLDPSRQRTVGKVSSVIGVKAATLAILYETDHRPNNPVTVSLTEARRCQESGSVNLRKEFAPGMGGSDTCHFCKKRVYVMERLSAEGYFFHRECFRCEVCSATLRLGGHVFDQGTFYCKLHFSQRKTGNRLRKPEVRRSDAPVSDSTDGYSASGSLCRQPSDKPGANPLSKTQEDPVQKVLQDTESSTKPQLSDLPTINSNRDGECSAQDPSTASDPLAPSSPPLSKVESSYTRGEVTIRNHRWTRKIRATLPLILVKPFDQRRRSSDALIEEGDSDFEEIHTPRKHEHHAADSLYPLQEEPSHDKSSHVEIPHYRTHGTSPIPKSNTAQQLAASTPGPHQHGTVSPKRKLILSTSEKERLLNWDLSTPGTYSSTAAAIDKAERYSARPGNSQKPQTVPEPQPEPDPAPAEPEPSPPPSGFQMWASVLRRSFSGAANNPKVIRRNRPRRARPLSEGSFGFNFLFSGSAQNQEEEMRKRSRADRSGSRSETEGRSEITAMLEQVTLSNKPSGASKDDMASLPPRKLNFFSSMRLKRNEGGNGSKTDHQAKDIWNILSKFRNNAPSQQQQQQQQEQEDCSSSEEDQKSVTQWSESGHSERRRKHEVMQTKREQLKRLHRAQLIQRQLEEVEEKQRALEEKGVALEKVLRGESEETSVDEAELLQTWFKLVLDKNKLTRYESELMIFAQELELEDRQSQLQQDLRCRMATEDCKKSAAELAEEQALLDEVMKVVEERDRLVSLLEEQRLQEKAEDRDLESLILSKRYQFHWA
ncbi:F-actin-monooxygenase mical2b isoform X1 [Clarias gariepinus]|uniref:F-actin-monooxygenase mical2b isoform X1 n=1 Tax=Clarias gariepinus TaxID=13013 RepID=UPI00234E2C92|nr:F-actin-monooxygenase mical2b isoform X1 [Clarias gariepinus]XP_053361384.1 F-actin-monooxygenase mical2b isoform X1 [Clarias gariepinus]